jgi:N-acetylglucosaminyl-diphospho-decaprenol L-rhamnosyltransferase
MAEMDTHIDVAVVIVTYKSAALTIASLVSLDSERKSQRLKLSVFVVDNASGDYSQIVEAVGQAGWTDWVHPMLAPINGGFSYGNNLGIREAYKYGRPNFIYLLNPDTLVRPQGLSMLLNFMKTHPDVGIAGSSFETEDLNLWPFAFRFPSIFSEFERGLRIGLVTRMLSRWTVPRIMEQVPQRTDWICGASMLIRPVVLSTVGCLDENFFLYYEETEFCYRALKAGFPTWYVPESRIMHIIGKSTNLDDESRVSRRLPSYWFESRTRYFVATHGVGVTALIDLAAVLSSALGIVRRKLQRRASTPFYIRDLFSHSVLRSRNRGLAPLKSFFPPI